MKLIKKINALLVGIMLVGGMAFSALSMWSSWENNETDQLLLGGKANPAKSSQTAVEKNEANAIDVDAETIDSGPAVPVQEQENEVEGTAMGETVQNVEYHPFSFVAIGDSESYGEETGHNKELAKVLDHARKKHPDFALFTGDIISASGTKLASNVERIKNVKALIEQYFNNYYIAFGKHDIECGKDCVDAWYEIFFDVPKAEDGEKNLYHSFDYQNTHFAILLTDYPEKHSVNREQLSWLEKDLEQNSLPNTIVVQHVPPVTFFEESARECHDLTCVPEVKEKLMAIFRKYKVDCVISGHEHAFDHKIVDGIDFVLSGNTGNGVRYKNVIKGDIFSYFSVNEKSIILQAFNTENELIREIKIK